MRTGMLPDQAGMNNRHSAHSRWPAGPQGCRGLCKLRTRAKAASAIGAPACHRSWVRRSMARRQFAAVVGPDALAPVAVATGLRAEQVEQGVAVARVIAGGTPGLSTFS